MATTNNDGYIFINTVLRKEINGSPITTDRFNNTLKIAFSENNSDEYAKFELNQNNSDYFRFIKKNEVINPDVFGKYDLSELTYDYWHISNLYYNNGTRDIEIDVTTDNEWGQRLTSSMELPTADYPICKIKDGDLFFSPLEQTYDTTNLVTNSGYPGTTDWVDTNTDEIADDWDVEPASATPIILNSTGEYGFEGRAQGGFLDQALIYIGYDASNPIRRNKWYYFEFEYFFESGVEDVTAFGIINAATEMKDLDPPVIDIRTKISGVFFNDFQTLLDTSFRIYAQIVSPEVTRKLFVDKVFVSELNEPTDVILCYLKQPATPYFDWYYDDNDRIQPLSEGETYTLQANERYIDKDDGTVRTSGYVITAEENKTVEMEIPDDDKQAVFYSMLSKFGIPLDQLDATQYSMQMESKESAK